MSILTKIIMKELPILFSAPMIRAILDGRKTMTRRIVKSQFNTVWGSGCPNESTFTLMNGGQRWKDAFAVHVDRQTASGHWEWLFCPYGKPGDRLWVRETGWQPCEPTPRAWREGADTWPKYVYDADGISEDEANDNRKWGWRRRSAIHMPRWASRITLEITDVRVQRLQDIDEHDAIAEGCTDRATETHPDDERLKIECGYFPPSSHERAFRLLWESINGAGSWDANPWVWRVEFYRRDSEVTP